MNPPTFDPLKILSPELDIYTGVWINERFGRIHGSTLTLPRREGAFLIAFLAMYVGIAGQGFWMIIRFHLHRAFSGAKDPDAIYNQRQAVLRNSDSGHSTAIALIQMLWAWRSVKNHRKFRRILPVMALSSVLSLAFLAAGILSSRVTSNDSSEVLLTGKACEDFASKWSVDNLDTPHGPITDYTSSRSTIQVESMINAINCYRSATDTDNSRCQVYIKPRLPYTKSKNLTCPYTHFGEMCQANIGNIEFDTGFLSSDSDLGINGGPKFLIRQTRQCFPLGKRWGWKSEETTAAGERNYDFRYEKDRNGSLSDHITFSSVMKPDNSSDARYRVHAITRPEMLSSGRPPYPDVSGPGELPFITQPDQPDSRMTLLFLESYGISYAYPTSDSWFSSRGRHLLYPLMSSIPVSVISCATNNFICNVTPSKENQCVRAYTYPLPWAFYNPPEYMSKLWPNEQDRLWVHAAISILWTGTGVFDPDSIYGSNLPYPSLLSSVTLRDGKQFDPFPDKRWEEEMEYAFQASLSSLQGHLVRQASGLIPLFLSQENVSFPQNAVKPLCTRQIIRSSQHQSFSVLGISLIIGIGGLFMIVGLYIEWIAVRIERINWQPWRRSKRNSREPKYAQIEWHATSSLQLQRLAHESAGFGTWSRANHTVPITKPNETLGVLDFEILDDPILKHPSRLESEGCVANLMSDDGESGDERLGLPKTVTGSMSNFRGYLERGWKYVSK